jgi:hypothetical protein
VCQWAPNADRARLPYITESGNFSQSGNLTAKVLRASRRSGGCNLKRLGGKETKHNRMNFYMRVRKVYVRQMVVKGAGSHRAR